MKPIISPMQALLIVIEHVLCEEKKTASSPTGVTFFSQEHSFTPITVNSNNMIKDDLSPLDSDALISLCVLGVQSEKDKATMMGLFKHQLLSDYVVSMEFDVINNDPVRRFFETTLAEKSLKYGLKQLSMDDLNTHLEILNHLLVAFDQNFAIPGCLKYAMDTQLGDDFFELGKALNKQTLSADNSQIISFSLEDWDKMGLLWWIWVYSYILSGYEQQLPIPIYNQGFFKEEHRSRSCRYSEKEPLFSNNVGIFKSTMPTPAYSTMRTKKITKGLVLSDYRRYEPGAWYDYNAKFLVHPFCNSISGSMLVQLRILALIKKYINLFKNHPFLTNKTANGFALKSKLAAYFRIFSALLLYGCGGHSWFEFLTPIMLAEVREEFSDIPEFDKLDMGYVLFHNNHEAIRQAIDESIQYNKQILQRKKVYNEIKQTVPFLNPTSTNDDNYKRLVCDVLKQGSDEYDRWARLNFKYTNKLNIDQFDPIYDLFVAIENTDDSTMIWSSLNAFFSSQMVVELCKQLLHHYIYFKISQEPSEDNDYSFFSSP